MIKVHSLPQKIHQRLEKIYYRGRDNLAVRRKAVEISAYASSGGSTRPVVFFKASTGTSDFTLNNAFHVLAAWGLRLQAVPVVHFVCRSGMSHCVLGTIRQKPYAPPPCRACIAHSRALFAGADVHWFGYQRDLALAEALASLSVPELVAYEHHHQHAGIDSPIPLGAMAAPGLRWILRRHNLWDDEKTRYLCREYILSAWNVAREFVALLEQVDPQAVVVFNGQFYPEAVAGWLARRRGIRVVTHEVGLQPFSAFFTEGEATAYPIHIPDNFELSVEQNARLEAYLENRFKGKFSMAGIRFWPEMKGLDEAFLQKMTKFKQVVPVFTNVVFDTSQPHANTIFSDMFVWLDMVLEMIRTDPETLFVIRAHPDEMRSGKESLETVADWMEARQAGELPNVVFIGPDEYISSYELIQRAKFVMIYNSTIGLEATILGAPVLSGGKARFTQYPTVFFPRSATAFRRQAEVFLTARKIKIPPEFPRNARRFLYYQLFRTSLPFDHFLTSSYHPSLTRFTAFHWRDLLPENSPAIAAIVDGILANSDFLLKP